jgi:hypothetical protein
MLCSSDSGMKRNVEIGFCEAILIDQRRARIREVDTFPRAVSPESNRLKNSAWKRKRVLAFACQIKYGLPVMNLQLRCPHYFMQRVENVTLL